MLQKHWEEFRTKSVIHLTNKYKFILSDEEINDRIRIANRLIAEWEIQQGIML